MRAIAYWSSLRTASRLRGLLLGSSHGSEAAFSEQHAGGLESAGLCREVLEGGGGELFLDVVGRLGETNSLRAAACVCIGWSQLLDRARSKEADDIWKRAVLVAPRRRMTLGAAVRSLRPGDRLRIAAGTHPSPLHIPHALEIDAEPGALLTGPITLGVGGGDSSGGRLGTLRGVQVDHFYETAITVLAGDWLLERCGVASSRAPARACVSLVLRAAATVSMEGCELSGCSSGVLLSSAAAKLVARGCAFRNVRAAIASERGGRIEVDHCAFDLAQSLGDVGFKLAGDTVGHVSECEIGEAQGPQLWGRIVPPEGVRLGPRSTGLAP